MITQSNIVNSFTKRLIPQTISIGLKMPLFDSLKALLLWVRMGTLRKQILGGNLVYCQAVRTAQRLLISVQMLCIYFSLLFLSEFYSFIWHLYVKTTQGLSLNTNSQQQGVALWHLSSPSQPSSTSFVLLPWNSRVESASRPAPWMCCRRQQRWSLSIN